MSRTFFIILGLMALAVLPAYGQDQTSRCADCHFASGDPPAPEHLEDWDRSPHGRAGVGCEQCHGGDPTTFESMIAHQGVSTGRNPASPLFRTNIPATCGKCHAGPFVAFQDSTHYKLIEAGDENPPTCVTCHGPVAARLLSPAGLERACARCHGPSGVAPRPANPAAGRAMLEGIGDVRAALDAVRHLLDRVPAGARRDQLEADFQQAEVPLTQAIHAAHQFVYTEALERLGVARERVNRLSTELINPGN